MLPRLHSPWRLIWLGVACALAVGLPFVGKAFHIDDTVVLRVAEQITRDPARPFAGDINWFGDPRPIFEETTNPPLVSYYLAPVVARFGFAEAPLHLAMLLFLVMLGVATAVLSHRFAGGSVWPVLLVMLSPAVVVSTNVMRDVPLAALSAGAVALFVLGVDRRSWPLAAGGAAVAGLALLTKYSGAVLLPLLACYALLQRRGRYALLVAVPLLMLGLWSLSNHLAHGRIHLAYLMAERRGNLPWQDRFYAALVVVGAMLFAAPALAADAVARRRWWAAAAAVAAGVAAFWGARMHLQGPVGWQYALWVTTGAALLCMALAPALRAMPRALSRHDPAAADAVFLALWAGAVIAFAVFFVMFQAVRHLIPAVVPLALLAVRVLRLGERRWLRITLGSLVAAQAAVAFLVAAADYEYAHTYRDFARAVRQRHPAQEVWFVGNWGWQRHCLSQGFTQVAAGGEPPPAGALLLIPERVHKGGLPPGLELSLIEEKTYRGRIPIHTMDGSVGARFYSVVGRSVPYAFTRERTLEVFRIHRVEPEAKP